jgi:hypothetical protein
VIADANRNIKEALSCKRAQFAWTLILIVVSAGGGPASISPIRRVSLGG